MARNPYPGGQIGIVNIPNIDQPQFREQANFYTDLQKKINTVKNFALDLGEADATERGVADAVNNPVSLADFVTRNNDEERKKLVGEKSFNAYGKAVRDQNLIMISNDIELAGNSGLNSIVKNGLADEDDPEVVFNNLTIYAETLSDTLKPIDPISYVNTKTKLSQKRDELFLEYLKDVEETIKEKQTNQYNNDIRNLSITSKAELANQEKMLDDKATDLNLGREFVESVEKTINSKYKDYGDTIVRDVLKIIDSGKNKEKGYQALQRYLDDPVRNLKQFTKYMYDNFGSKSDLYNTTKVATQKLVTLSYDNLGDDTASKQYLNGLIDTSRDFINKRRDEIETVTTLEKQRRDEDAATLIAVDKAIEEQSKIDGGVIKNIDLALDDGVLTDSEKKRFGVTTFSELMELRDTKFEEMVDTYGSDMPQLLNDITSDPIYEEVGNQLIQIETTKGFDEYLKGQASIGVLNTDMISDIRQIIGQKGKITKAELKAIGIDTPDIYRDSDPIKITYKDLNDIRAKILSSNNVARKDFAAKYLPGLMPNHPSFHEYLFPQSDRDIQYYKEVRAADQSMDALAIEIMARYDQESVKEDFDEEEFVNTIMVDTTMRHYQSELNEEDTNLYNILSNNILVGQALSVDSYTPGLTDKKRGDYVVSAVYANDTNIIFKQFDLGEVFKQHDTIQSVKNAIKIAKDLNSNIKLYQYHKEEGITQFIFPTIANPVDYTNMKTNIDAIIQNLQIQEQVLKGMK